MREFSARMRTVLAAVSAASVTASAAVAPPAFASQGWGLHGTYLAMSNGQWAKTNDTYRDATSVTATWTIVTSCSYPTECTGTVTTDQNWTATIYQKSGLWYVKRSVHGWQHCPDGSAGDGFQEYKFWPAGQDGTVDEQSSTFFGEDHTMGPSGACGTSKPLVITMPFRLVKTSNE